jgi:hypothetical protein
MAAFVVGVRKMRGWAPLGGDAFALLARRKHVTKAPRVAARFTMYEPLERR